MSSKLARQEMSRFLQSDKAEVLSVSGRWGVGKTYGWRLALDEAKKKGVFPRERYAYVSAFGVRSLDDLKAAIFQGTVKLDAPSLEPTLETFQELLTSTKTLASFAEQWGRKGSALIKSAFSMLPWVGKASELLLPGAALLIRNQIICIDDLERAGQGLDIADILGFVSSLREQKNCKILLLLNEQGFGSDQRDTFRKHLEKVADQAVEYTPTPAESAATVLDERHPVEGPLARRTTMLGITNIRIIQRIRRFLSFVEADLADLHPTVMEETIACLALLGWSVFEPELAPAIDHIRGRNPYVPKNEPSAKEAGWNALLDSYGFAHFSEYDAVLLKGLQSGGFDHDAVRLEACKLSDEQSNAESQAAARRPWDILGAGFGDDEAAFADAMVEAIEKHGRVVSTGQADVIVSTLRELDRHKEADRLIGVFLEINADRPRTFFDLTAAHLRQTPDPAFSQAFAEKLASMPLEHDPKELLLKIDRDGGWGPSHTAFLASLSEDDYVRLLMGLQGDELHSVIRSGLMFSHLQGAGPSEAEIGAKMIAALSTIGKTSRLNAMRVKPYVPADALAQAANLE